MALTSFDASQYRATTVPEVGDLSDLSGTIEDYRLMLGCVLEAMLDRYDRRRDYPFLDTKLDLRTGEDFAEDDPLRGPGTIYGWIQGRGLEALAGHEAWLRRCGGLDDALRGRLAERTHRVLAEVFEKMEAIRAANAGRLFFAMTTEGQPLRMGPEGRMVPHQVPADSPANVTELFYVKGMLAAARALGDQARVAEACAWYDRIDRDVQDDRLARDQQPLDPTNVAVQSVPGRRGSGGRMLALGAAGLFLDVTGDARYRDMGLAYLDHMLQYHLNTDEHPAVGQPFDGWEFVGEDGKPWLDESGALLSDPGHTCELVGFALKFLDICRRRGILDDLPDERVANYNRVLPAVLERNFANGFVPSGYGIVKAYDLAARKPLRTDMPWWNLPETMRAAAYACAIAGEEDRPRLVQIAAKCSNAFVEGYVRTDLHLMAYQTLGEDGKPIATIPATPDADPGYHTGLSIIDYLNVLEELTGRS